MNTKDKLNAIMRKEKATKIKLIGAILDSKHGTNIDLNAEFNRLYDMSITELNIIIDNVIHELLNEIDNQLKRFNIKQGKI